MDNSHIMIMLVIVSIFAITGLICGLIIYSKTPKHIQERNTVKNSFIIIIVSLSFVSLFNLVYFSWHILHNHRVKPPRHSTKMV